MRVTIDGFPDNSASSWFEHLSSVRVPSLRLFCFPYAGGTAEVYRRWQRWFPQHVDICLVQMPGRGRRINERPFTRIIPLVNAIADRMGDQITGPFALYGHSMGALVSFELARELSRRHGIGPQHLFVSGRRAPQWPKDEPPTFHLPDDEFIPALKRLNGTPDQLLENPELMQFFLHLIRADFEATETYEYSPGDRLPCPISVYGGLEDQHVPAESCRAWQEQTSGRCKVRMFKGDHFFIRDPDALFVTSFRNDVLTTIAAPCP